MILPPFLSATHCLATAWERKNTIFSFRKSTASQFSGVTSMASHALDDTGVVDQNVDAVSVGVDLLQDRIDGGKVRKVGADLGKLAALSGDLGGGLVAAAAGYAENVGTGSCQRHADALAQAGVGARDHSVFHRSAKRDS